ncbi:MAG: class I SAM-dependent methyltransferase [Betaproteobacteria bacterium]
MSSTESSEYFDQRAKTWDEDPMKTARAEAVAAGMRSLAPLASHMSGLEYGCGTGLLSFALQPHLQQITLADSSPGMLNVLQQKIEAQHISNMRPVKLDLTSDPLPSERYDLIYSLMTFHHIPDTDKILRDLYALLTGPGYLCIADLDSEDGSFHGLDFSGHKGFDREELAQQAKNVGFRNIRFSSVFTITKGTPARKYPVFLMVAEK